MDYEKGLPKYAVISDVKKHDVKAAKQTNFRAILVLEVDRAYVDYDWLYYLDSTGVFFITRLAQTIPELYRACLDIEVFFKPLKQML